MDYSRENCFGIPQNNSLPLTQQSETWKQEETSWDGFNRWATWEAFLELLSHFNMFQECYRKYLQQGASIILVAI